jgi:hypothetical protein
MSVNFAILEITSFTVVVLLTKVEVACVDVASFVISFLDDVAKEVVARTVFVVTSCFVVVLLLVVATVGVLFVFFTTCFVVVDFVVVVDWVVVGLSEGTSARSTGIVSLACSIGSSSTEKRFANSPMYSFSFLVNYACWGCIFGPPPLLLALQLCHYLLPPFIQRHYRLSRFFNNNHWVDWPGGWVNGLCP